MTKGEPIAGPILLFPIDGPQRLIQMTLTADTLSLREITLKEQGIYALPDGTQVVACARDERALVLYYLRDWKLYGAEEVLAERNAPAFRLLEADTTGDILMYGYPTRWTVGDLVDTGRVATR